MLCLSFPLRAYSRLSITRIVSGIGVTSFRPASFRPASFLPACRRDADRNRGPGRVPGSPRNLSIRPTRSPPSRPPTYSFFASLYPPLSAPAISVFTPATLSSTTVPSSIYARSFDSSPSFEFFPSSPSLLSRPYPFNSFIDAPFFHFCRCVLSSFRAPLAVALSLCSFFLSSQISLHVSPITSPLPPSPSSYFPSPTLAETGPPQILLLVDSQKITEILRSSLPVLIQAFVPAVTPRGRARHFSMKYHGRADKTYAGRTPTAAVGLVEHVLRRFNDCQETLLIT